MENALKMLKNMFAELTIGPWGPGCPGGPRIPWGPWKNMDDLIALLVDVIRKKNETLTNTHRFTCAPGGPIGPSTPLSPAGPWGNNQMTLRNNNLKVACSLTSVCIFPYCSLYISLGTNKEKYWKNFFSWRSFPFSLIISGDTSHSYGFQA